MLAMISDFRLAESIIKKICEDNNVDFTDCKISSDVDSGVLCIGECKNIGQTIFNIVTSYIDKFIPNFENKNNFLLLLANVLRNIIYNEETPDDLEKEYISQSIYQKPIVWLLMKDIICPMYNIDIDNIKIVLGKNPYVDIAQYYEEGEVKEFPFIFVNEIGDDVVQNASILIEAIYGHGLDIKQTIKYMLNRDIKDKVDGLLKMAFENDSQVEEFWNILFSTYNVEKFSGIKKAQFSNSDATSQWWFLGLAESMLEPLRGTDWTTTKLLSGRFEEFWDKVEKIRKKKGSEVPFNMLLSIKRESDSSEKTDPNKTLQSLLSSDRIW